MKIIAYAALAAAGLAPVASTAKTDNSIVVSSAPTLDQWTGQVGAMLDHNLATIAYPPLTPASLPEGVAAVRFMCGPDGKPTAVALSQKSGSFRLDNIAMRTVANIKTLHPLPAGIGPDQQYEAVIVLANDQQDLDRRLTRYREARASTPLQPALAVLITAGAARS